MDGPPESEQGATRTDGFPVRAGECGVFPQLLFEPRIAACGADPTYSRTQEVLAVHGLVPQWSRLPQPRIQWVKSGRCQYTSGLTAYSALLRARLGRALQLIFPWMEMLSWMPR